MTNGILNFSTIEMVIYTLITTHITIISVTVYLHRCQAHRALKLSPMISHFFRAWLWLYTGMRTAQWVAIHRKHHAKCETEEDPHSPRHYGIETLLLCGTELYKKESCNKATIERYSAGTPKDWIENNLYSKYSWLGILITMSLNILLFGFIGLTVWAVQMAWIPFLACGVINGLGHYIGKKPYTVNDDSTNILPLGLLIGGEELHNNHHAYPSSAKLAHRSFEFDIGWLYIRLFHFLGLASQIRVKPESKISEYRQEHILRNILADQVAVVTMYDRKVMQKTKDSSELNTATKFREELVATLNDKENRVSRFEELEKQAKECGNLLVGKFWESLEYFISTPKIIS